MWDGKISNMIITSHGYPELHAELEEMTPKERADRLRSLALIGLLQVKNLPNTNVEQSPALIDEKDDKESVRQELKKKLISSL